MIKAPGIIVCSAILRTSAFINVTALANALLNDDQDLKTAGNGQPTTRLRAMTVTNFNNGSFIDNTNVASVNYNSTLGFNSACNNNREIRFSFGSSVK